MRAPNRLGRRGSKGGDGGKREEQQSAKAPRWEQPCTVLKRLRGELC